MRTTGTLQDVYEAAKHYCITNDIDDRPMNPVVRKENGRWELSSGLIPMDEKGLEIKLEDFDYYFYETYSEDSFEVTVEIENDFIEIMEG